MPADESPKQMDPAKGRPRDDTAGTGSAPETREEEAHGTRSGRPMPEEDSADRVQHHKSGYGGEHGEPQRPDEPESGAEEAE